MVKFKMTAYLISFLSGIFLGLCLYIFYQFNMITTTKQIKENFKVEKPDTDDSKDNSQDDSQKYQNINNSSMDPAMTKLTKTNSQNDKIAPILPAYDDNFMLLTTFNKGENVSNNEMKWYDNNIDIDSILKTDYNKGIYFNLSNTISMVDDKVMSLAKGVSIRNVSLSGPAALYFANNTKNTFFITDFTIIFMVKFVNISNNSTLFEILCNTSVTNEYDDPVYTPQVISMNVIRVTENIVNIDVIFGSYKYTIKDIDINVLINDTIHLISLSYDSSNLFVIIDNNMYTFELAKQENITLGPLPITINKNGELNCILYSFAYYKKSLSTADIASFQQYIHHNLSGVTNTMKETEEYKKLLQEAQDNEKKNKNKLKDVSKLLDKCVSTNVVEEKEVDPRNFQKNLFDPIPKIIAPVPSEM